MSKVWIGVAVVVLGAAVALYIVLGGGGKKAETAKKPAPRVDNSSALDPGPAGTGRSQTGEKPALPTRAKPDSNPGYVEHITKDGMRVRDKRGRPVANTDLERAPKRPFKSLKIDAKVVAAMGNKLRGVARKCKSEHPGDLSAGARVQPRVAFEIKAGQLNVTEAELKTESIKEDSEFSRCFYSGTIGLAVAASGHRDVERQRMTVPIELDKI